MFVGSNPAEAKDFSQMFFVIFLRPSRKMLGYYNKLDHNRSFHTLSNS
jgi:hypothetical protein